MDVTVRVFVPGKSTEDGGPSRAKFKLSFNESGVAGCSLAVVPWVVIKSSVLGRFASGDRVLAGGCWAEGWLMGKSSTGRAASRGRIMTGGRWAVGCVGGEVIALGN